MAYRFLVTEGINLHVAPRVQIDRGDIKFRLIDSGGAAVAGADVIFQIGWGSGTLLESGAFGQEPQLVVRQVTDANGEVTAPVWQLGYETGPQALLVQSEQASLEHIVLATWDHVRLDILDPSPTDRDRVAGGRFTLRARARDARYNDKPVPEFPLEVEVVSGAATFDVEGNPGPYAILNTIDDGTITLQGKLGRRANAINVAVRPYRHRQVPETSLAINLRSPAFLPFSFTSVPDTAVGSIPLPIRMDISASTDAVISLDDRNLSGIVASFRERQDRFDIEPPVGGERNATSTWTWTSSAETAYEVEGRLPDYPDTQSLIHRGDFLADLTGGRPALTNPGILSSGLRAYIQMAGGGNRDDARFLHADLVSGAIQYLGPNATSGPITVRVNVQNPNPPKRLVEARIKFKVRMSPFNSVVDDPATNPVLVPGGISETSGGPWQDELEISVSGTPGPHDVTIFLHASAENYDNLIDVTAEVTLEDEDSSGNLYQYDEDSTLFLRASVLRPRLLFAREDGSDFSPILEEAIRPVTVVDRQDNFVPPPSDSAFYIELRAHDLGPVVDCHVQIGAQKRITLDRVGTTPSYVLYRSPRCFAVMDSRNNGATIPNPTGTDEYIPADAGNDARAWILDEMPGNTLQPEPVRYSAGVRPVSYLSLVSTGDTNRGGLPHAPYVHIDIADDRSWPVTVATGTATTGGGLVATIAGWIQDAVADIHNPASIELEINGVTQTLVPQSEVASLGRPRAVRLNFSATVPVRFGVQGIKIVARNPFGGRTEKRFELTVDEATNNRASPAVFEVEVRPVGLYRAPELPELHYLMAAGTNLRSGTSAPPQIAATIASLEPFPSGAAMTTLPMAMPHRSAVGLQYASGPFMALRADRAASLSVVPSDILIMPLGGRIEYATAALPNALGPIDLVTQVLQHATLYGIEVWDTTAGSWKVADVARVGDEIRLVAEAYGHGDPPFLNARLEITDPSRRPQPGPERSVWVNLARVSAGRYEMASYYDAQFQEQPADRAVMLTHHADAPGANQLPLRTNGHGRLLGGGSSNLGHAEIDLPLRHEPARHTRNGVKVDQEGVGASAGRLGANATVTPATGELVIEVGDRFFPCRGLDVTVLRTYRSANDYDGPMGHGWLPSWHSFLWEVSENEVAFLSQEGQILRFTKNASGDWVPPPRLYGKLEKEAGGWRILMPGGHSLVFLPGEADTPAVFNFVAVEDRFANRLRLTYPHHGRLAILRDAFHRSYQVPWDEISGRVAKFGDFGGGTVAYEYYPDGDPAGHSGNLKAVHSPIVRNPDNPFLQGRSWTFGYRPASEAHRLETIQDPEGASQSLGPWLTIAFDSEGRVERQDFVRGSFTFAWSGDTLTWTDRRQIGHRTVFYSAAGDGFCALPHQTITEVTGVDQAQTFVWSNQRELIRHERPLGNALSFEYDDQAADPRDWGNLKFERQHPDGVRPAGVLQTIGQLNFHAQPTVHTPSELAEEYRFEPGLQEAAMIIDPIGRRIVRSWANGVLVREELPAVGRVLPGGASQTRTRAWTWNRWGQPLTETDENGVVTRYHYHPENTPGGRGAPSAVSAEDVPGGYVAKVEKDVNDPNTARASHLAPIRTIAEEFFYDQYGNRIYHKDGGGAETLTELNELGEPIRMVPPTGGEIRLRYNASGQLTERIERVIDPGLPAEIASAQPAGSGPYDVRTLLEYERDGLIKSRIVDADGLALKTSWDYDGNGNVETENRPGVHSTADTDPNDRIHNAYDEADSQITQIEGWGSAREIRREFGYDDNGDLDNEYWPGTGRLVRYARDGWGRMRAEIDALGNSREVFLDDIGNVTRTRIQGSIDGDPSHLGTLYESFQYWDEADRLVARRELSFTYNPSSSGGAPTRSDNGNGSRVEEWWHDAAGSVIRRRTPEGLQVDTTPDGHGMPRTVVDNDGTTATYTWNAHNQMIRVEQADSVGTLASVLTYTSTGLVTSETHAGTRRKTAWYDSRGQVRLEEDGVGNYIETRWDRAGRQLDVIHYLYENGRRINVGGGANPQTRTASTRTTYYPGGQVKEAFDFKGNLANAFEYDSTGRLWKVTQPEDGFVLPNGSIQDQNPGDEIYEYNYRSDGLLESIKDPDGRLLNHGYDNAGRLNGLTVQAASGVTPAIHGTTSIAYVRDGMDRVVRATDDNGTGGQVTSERLYNSFGRLAWEQQSIALPGFTARAYELNGGFLSDGRQSLVMYPGSDPAVRAIPDVHGNTDFIRENISGARILDAGRHQRWFSHRTFPNGISYGFGYDQFKEVLEIRSFTGTDFTDNNALIEGNRYDYDPRGLVTSDKDLKTDKHSRLSYDSMHRLDVRIDGYDATDPGALPSYGRWWSYDIGGNPEVVEGGAVRSRASDGRLMINRTLLKDGRFNAANQIQSYRIEETDAQGATQRRDESFVYDRRGNLIQDGQNRYVYDFRNRLVEIQPVSGSPPVKIYWDAFGRRVLTDGRHLVWWGSDLVMEEPDSSGWKKRWIYGAKPGELVSYETDISGSMQRYFVHENRSGSVSFLSDAAGNIVERYGYDSFGTPELKDGQGNPMAVTSGTGNAFLMNRHYFDASTGLYFVGPRVYHPFLARFLQRDPAGTLVDPTAGRNAYIYGGNNPENLSDDGNLALLAAIGIYLAFTAVIALAETGVEAGIDEAISGDDDSSFSFGSSYLRNFAIGLATNWIPGSFVGRSAGRLGAGIALRVGTRVALKSTARIAAARGAYHVSRYGARFLSSTLIEWGIENTRLGTNRSLFEVALGNAVGDVLGIGIRRAIRPFRIRRVRAVDTLPHFPGIPEPYLPRKIYHTLPLRKPVEVTFHMPELWQGPPIGFIKIGQNRLIALLNRVGHDIPVGQIRLRDLPPGSWREVDNLVENMAFPELLNRALRARDALSGRGTNMGRLFDNWLRDIVG